MGEFIKSLKSQILYAREIMLGTQVPMGKCLSAVINSAAMFQISHKFCQLYKTKLFNIFMNCKGLRKDS